MASLTTARQLKARPNLERIAAPLFDHGADGDVAEALGETALHRAAVAGGPATVQPVPWRGADVDR